MALLAPSLLSADFLRLDRACDFINRSACDWLHLDIMDGVFVPNLSYGFPVVEAVAKTVRKPLDAHLMMVEPQRYIERFAQIGVQYLSVHYEASAHLHRLVQQIKDCGMKAGVALNPHTPVSVLEDLLPCLDYVLLMSVNPGFGGQKFIDRTYAKIARLQAARAERQYAFLIEIDGGVGLDNAAQIVGAGADVLVAGHAIFRTADPFKTAESFHSLLL